MAEYFYNCLSTWQMQFLKIYFCLYGVKHFVQGRDGGRGPGKGGGGGRGKAQKMLTSADKKEWGVKPIGDNY